jgi:4-diphosphocytidyl-2-C-methyl-D-erythritol kinase
MQARAFAKINLGLVVGPRRPDGKHEIATVLERIDLHDLVDLDVGQDDGVRIEGFVEDTLVTRALALFDRARLVPPRWRVRIEKHIPLSSGLGGGSSDAATALRLANELVADPLPAAMLHEIATEVGSDVPFFLEAGAKLATGDGTTLEPVELPRSYSVVLALPLGTAKQSTAAVYSSLPATGTRANFDARWRALREALRTVLEPRELGMLPANALVPAPEPTIGGLLHAFGAFRVDVSGAGPTIYGLFEHAEDARKAQAELRAHARTWLAQPVPGP